jgi:hypothetical protein
MKRLLLFMLLLWLGERGLCAQESHSDTSKIELPSVILSVGYFPKPSYNALKTSVEFTNLFFNRIGAYASVQKGLDSDYFSNIYGLTVTYRKNIYLWGGIDFFTSHGWIDKGIKGARKELGIGVFPYKKLVLKAGYSFLAGFPCGAGFRITL